VAAFGRADEARILERLRADRQLALSLVAEDEDGVVGHLALSPVSVEPPAGSFAALGLGPMAVVPTTRERALLTHELAR
jgi:putative acetyltransferase